MNVIKAIIITRVALLTEVCVTFLADFNSTNVLNVFDVYQVCTVMQFIRTIKSPANSCALRIESNRVS